jgi:endoglucanase
VTLEQFVRHLEKIKMSGTYWAGGPGWGNYALSIEPKDGVDRQQMKVMGR